MSSFIVAALGESGEHAAWIKQAKQMGEGLVDLEDDVLLERFIAERDSEAFGTLVLRHGPAVLRVCRRWLGMGQQADDAFQATFLVLVNRADAIRRKENIGPWLQGVARRVAGRLKMQADQRQKREGVAVDVHEVAAAPLPLFDDLGDVVRNEVERLPETYRNPIVLCYWEGLSSEQAAERLNCPTGTLKWRLSRARDMLRQRFSKLSLGLVMFLLGRRPSTASAGELSAGGGMPSQIWGTQTPLVVPENLLSDTVAIAGYFRDHPFIGSPLPDALGIGKRRRLGGFWFWVVTWLVASAIILAAIPSLPVIRRLASGSYTAIFQHGSGSSCH